MKRRVAALCLVGIVCVSLLSHPAEASPELYPGTEWRETAPAALGWSIPALESVRRFVATLPAASIVVIDHGQIVFSQDDLAVRIKISSMRKNLLSALFGIYASKNGFNLDATLAELQVDDEPPLTQIEKSATVRMLLEARSGIYHGYVAGTPGMREGWPSRGSHAPGTFWYYNNWDFNALGTIFDKEFDLPIAQAFKERIAKPIGMQDFRPEDMYYLKAPADAEPNLNKSMHPAYHFRVSARDLARFGYLFLRQGKWRDTAVVPSAWVRESTQPHSEVGPKEGYGYLWWIDGFDLAEKSFSARGALAKYLVVVPARDLVIVYLNHAEFPDGPVSAEDMKRLPSISHEQMSEFLNLILRAQRERIR